MNHLHPPFNDVRARRAILTAMSQEDYMRAFLGDDDKMWKPLPGFFTPGTPLYTEEGGEILKGPRDFEAAKRLLAQSGYAGQPVTCLVAQDQAPQKAWGEITADLLKRLGMKVDYVATDWGTVVARRTQKSPPGQGGWQMFHTFNNGAGCVNPGHTPIRANGDEAWFGWPNIPQVEAEVAVQARCGHQYRGADCARFASGRIYAALDHQAGSAVHRALRVPWWRSPFRSR